MNNVTLTAGEMRAQFDNEWVLVVDPEVDPESGAVVSGRVAAHSPVRDEVYDAALNLKPSRSAFLCFREPGEGSVLVL
jgi:hypothetical protein